MLGGLPSENIALGIWGRARASPLGQDPKAILGPSGRDATRDPPRRPAGRETGDGTAHDTDSESRRRDGDASLCASAMVPSGARVYNCRAGSVPRTHHRIWLVVVRRRARTVHVPHTP